MFWNGSTAIEGFSGRGKAGRGPAAASLGRTRYTRTGRAIFFELLLSGILEGDVELTLGILLHPCRHADLARCRKPFQTCRHIDAITKDIVTVDDNIAKIDANSELDLLGLGDLGVPFGHIPLNLDGAAQRIHHAGEFDQHAVACSLDNTAMMLGDSGIDERFPDRLEPRQCAFFVAAH